MLHTHACVHGDTGVCEKNIWLARASAKQSSSRNFIPDPDLMLRKPIFQSVFFFGGVFVSQTPVRVGSVGPTHWCTHLSRHGWFRPMSIQYVPCLEGTEGVPRNGGRN